MGRKLNYVFSFRPINIPGAREGDERGELVDLSAEASRPGRLVAATACPGRHETPGTDLGWAERPRKHRAGARSEGRDDGRSGAHAEDDLVVAVAFAGEDAGRVIA